MAFFEWTPQLSVGLESVDRQHRLLIGYINELSDAVDDGRSHASLQKVLERLRNYTKVHFAYEEAMFKVYRYEEANDHAHAHHAFVRMIEECETRQAKGEASVAADLRKHLKTWLAEHIRIEDKAYAVVLVERGAAMDATPRRPSAHESRIDPKRAAILLGQHPRRLRMLRVDQIVLRLRQNRRRHRQQQRLAVVQPLIA